MHALRRFLLRCLRLPVIRPVAVFVLGIAVRVLVLSGEDRIGSPFVVMQVGGRGGSDPFTKWLRMRRLVRTIGVEPESTGLGSLRASYAYDHLLTQGLAEAEGAGTLYITKAKGWCSLLEPDEVAIAKVATPKCFESKPFSVTGTEQIALTTLDAVRSTVPQPDYLQIDVQGAELRVLRGALSTIAAVSVIELEVRFSPIYKQEPLFPEVHTFLEAHGFRLFHMTRQGDTEFGVNYVEANACYYNERLAAENPARMADLRLFAEAKHELYTDPVLRLYGDVFPTERFAPAAG